MKIIETDYSLFRTVTAHVSETKEAVFFTTVAKEGVQFWSVKDLLAEPQ